MISTNKGRILYVEDNQDNRKLVRRVLEADGYTFDEAKDAQDALEYLNTEYSKLDSDGHQHA